MARIDFGFVLIYLVAVAWVGLMARPEPSDLAVVLGNEVVADGTPSLRLQARLDAGEAVFRAKLAPLVMVSGGIDPAGHDEAAVMAAYLVKHGVPESAIIRDSTGVDTRATARAAAGVLHGKGRVLAVTQWFHIPRTIMALHSAGFDDVSATWPRFVEVRDVYSFLREAVAVAVYGVGLR